MNDFIYLIHAISGTIVATLGLAQLILKKGNKLHIILGNIYVYTWFVLLATGAIIGSYLITIIGAFGYYFALTGSRIAHLKTREFQLIDKLIVFAGIGLLAFMIYLALALFVNKNAGFGIIFLVFGGLFLLTIQGDVRKYLLKQEHLKAKYGNMDWYFEHLFRMSISFIAAITAFTSIQNVFGHMTLNFLVPTIIGVPLIIWGSRKAEKKIFHN